MSQENRRRRPWMAVIGFAVIASAITSPGVAQVTTAATIFSDDFEAESNPCEFNYDTFTNFDVTDGTVDMLNGSGNCYITGAAIDNTSLFVDLDGTTSNPGVLTTKPGRIPVVAGQTYTAQFDLAGSQRGDDNTVTVTFGPVSATYVRTSAEPFITETLSFVATSTGEVSLTFENGGGDNFGALLDNIVITGEPPTTTTSTTSTTQPPTTSTSSTSTTSTTSTTLPATTTSTTSTTLPPTTTSSSTSTTSTTLAPGGTDFFDETALSNGALARLTGSFTCEVGRRFRIEVSLTQGDVVGRRVATGRCTGEPVDFRMRVRGGEFVTGTAQIEGRIQVGTPVVRIIDATFAVDEGVSIQVPSGFAGAVVNALLATGL